MTTVESDKFVEDDVFVSLRDVNEIIDNQLQKIKDSGKKRLTPAELNLQIVKKEINRIRNKRGRNMGEWISVTERLPEEFQSVWASCKSLIDNRPNWTIETVYDPYLNCPWGHIPMLEYGKAVVYAWMERPLPEPPNGET